jgi:hypothetical protein
MQRNRKENQMSKNKTELRRVKMDDDKARRLEAVLCEISDRQLIDILFRVLERASNERIKAWREIEVLAGITDRTKEAPMISWITDEIVVHAVEEDEENE